jgi:hypothetical protein
VEHHLRRWFPANQSVAKVTALRTSDDDGEHPVAANSVTTSEEFNTAPLFVVLSTRQRVDFLSASS